MHNDKEAFHDLVVLTAEDIDLTYIPDNSTSKKQYDKALKGIEKVMSNDANIQKMPEERNDRNKSAFVWFDDKDKEETKLKFQPYFISSYSDFNSASFS